MISAPGCLHPELLLVKMDGCARCNRDVRASGAGLGGGAAGAADADRVVVVGCSLPCSPQGEGTWGNGGGGVLSEQHMPSPP